MFTEPNWHGGGDFARPGEALRSFRHRDGNESDGLTALRWITASSPEKRRAGPRCKRYHSKIMTTQGSFVQTTAGIFIPCAPPPSVRHPSLLKIFMRRLFRGKKFSHGWIIVGLSGSHDNIRRVGFPPLAGAVRGDVYTLEGKGLKSEMRRKGKRIAV